MTAVHETDALPLRFGTDAEFAALRRSLLEHGYTEEAVCARMEIPSLYLYKTIREGRTDRHLVADALDVLIRVFLDGEAVPRPRVDDLLGPGTVDVLTALGLLAAHPTHPDRYAATVQLYPTQGLHVVSDLGPSAPGVLPPDDPLAIDVVYSAITENTGNFLRPLPAAPRGRFLELCSGTGIAALLAARSADHAWAVDITERSTRFAEFNARINGIENVTALQGDLYEPVAGTTFDWIVAHPPYVPSVERRYIYAHGGQDGEDIIRGVVAGLPRYLSPGGRFFCTCASTDRRGEPLEQRIRAMLGDRESDFDVLVIEHYGYHPSEFYFHVAASEKISFEEAGRFHLLFKELDATRRLYCTMVVQRHAEPRATFTARRDGVDQAGAAEVDWLMGWLGLAHAADLASHVLDARPSLARGARLDVAHEAVDGGWEARSCRLSTEHPFPRTIDLSTSAAMLIAGFDGTRTAREYLQHLRAQGTVPDTMPEGDFARFLHHLVAEGALELHRTEALEGDRLPADRIDAVPT
jgi:SAM-dependent methyltransferase